MENEGEVRRPVTKEHLGEMWGKIKDSPPNPFDKSWHANIHQVGSDLNLLVEKGEMTDEEASSLKEEVGEYMEKGAGIRIDNYKRYFETEEVWWEESDVD